VIDVLEILVWIAAVVILFPVLVLLVEILVATAIPLTPSKSFAHEPRPPAAVLIPAHNEEQLITATIASLQPQLLAADRLIVIADNCTDQTAQVARAAGAEVAERNDPQRLGKDYAVAHGRASLEDYPPKVVVIVDADCRVAPGSIDVLVRSTHRLQRPVQANYLLELPPGAPLTASVNAFAFKVKNFVRPYGLSRLGLPCPLYGTGMAFPYPLLSELPLIGGHITEDMQLAVDSSLRGSPPFYCPQARVTSRLPLSTRAAAVQRTRWEHGHIQTILRCAPRLLWAGLSRGRLDVLALAADVMVPPLSLLVLFWIAATALAVTCRMLGGSWGPPGLLGIEALLLLVAVTAAWVRFGRSILRTVPLLAVPLYVAWKIPIYLAFLVRRQKAWVRTQRD